MLVVLVTLPAVVVLVTLTVVVVVTSPKDEVLVTASKEVVLVTPAKVVLMGAAEVDVVDTRVGVLHEPNTQTLTSARLSEQTLPSLAGGPL